MKGQVDGEEDVLVRVHSECLTGDVFHSLKCDCGEQLELALAGSSRKGRACCCTSLQEGRGIGLLNKLKAYELQEQGLDTVEANLGSASRPTSASTGSARRSSPTSASRRSGCSRTTRRRSPGSPASGSEVVAQEPIVVEPNNENRRYLDTKRDKLGHKLHHQDLRFDPDLYDGAEA